MTDDRDLRYLHRALELARAGIGRASPNPCVGALVVDAAGNIVGEGTHLYAARKHAEIVALEQAGGRAAGASLYLNLEPCCHTGRTGPCTEAVIRSGVKTVVVAMIDPNPQVAGKGLAQLRAAGIEVRYGLCEAEARKLNESFTRWIRTGRPLVTLKSAMTLDARIALPQGGGAITGEAARAQVQQLRHASDAILVGVGTVLQDDPLLTDRSGLARGRPLLRAVLDSQLRTPPDARLVQSAQDDVLLFYTAADERRRHALEERGVRLVQAGDGPRCDLEAVVSWLGGHAVTSLLVEGGSAVNSAALAAGIVDKVFFFYAPRLLGPQAVPFVQGAAEGFPLDVQSPSWHRFGDDFAVEGYLRDPYAAG
jgi:diaminohydroxyphosphoribosylaminopyrimidine deaminase/5-amino-6-(5-phosphoribosylamino)uracil reductase